MARMAAEAQERAKEAEEEKLRKKEAAKKARNLSRSFFTVFFVFRRRSSGRLSKMPIWTSLTLRSLALMRTKTRTA